MVQDERLRDDAKQLLRIAYERQVASEDVGLGMNLRAAAEERGMGYESRYLAALVDYIPLLSTPLNKQSIFRMP